MEQIQREYSTVKLADICPVCAAMGLTDPRYIIVGAHLSQLVAPTKIGRKRSRSTGGGVHSSIVD